MTAELKRLDWDTTFFGQDVFKVNLIDDDINLDSLCFPSKALIYVYSENLLKTKYHLVDKKITYVSPVSRIETNLPANDCVVGGHKPEDIPDLIQLSMLANRHSRFRVDTLVPAVKADELYRLWLERALKNPDDFLIRVAHSNGRVAGMNVLKKNETCFSIDLISVFDHFQGQGIGKHLVRDAAHEVAHRGGVEVEVTTQLDNKIACRLYEKMGFVKKSLSYIYHIHT